MTSNTFSVTSSSASGSALSPFASNMICIFASESHPYGIYISSISNVCGSIVVSPCIYFSSVTKVCGFHAAVCISVALSVFSDQPPCAFTYVWVFGGVNMVPRIAIRLHFSSSRYDGMFVSACRIHFRSAVIRCVVVGSFLFSMCRMSVFVCVELELELGGGKGGW